MEQISFSEYSRAANFGHRKLTPRPASSIAESTFACFFPTRSRISAS